MDQLFGTTYPHKAKYNTATEEATDDILKSK
jgi:hypothetical protein